MKNRQYNIFYKYHDGYVLILLFIFNSSECHEIKCILPIHIQDGFTIMLPSINMVKRDTCLLILRYISFVNKSFCIRCYVNRVRVSVQASKCNYD